MLCDHLSNYRVALISGGKRAHAAAGKPEGVGVKFVTSCIKGYQPLLDELLFAPRAVVVW